MKKILITLAGIVLVASCCNNKNTNDMNLTHKAPALSEDLARFFGLDGDQMVTKSGGWK